MASGATDRSAAQRLNVTAIADRAIDRIVMDSDRATEHRRGARNYASNFIKDEDGKPWSSAPAAGASSTPCYKNVGRSILAAARSYIEENPVTAGLVTEAQRYPWSRATGRLKGGRGQD